MPQINASDTIAWKSCRRRAWHDLHETHSAQPPDPFDLLIMHEGMAHERRVLAELGPYTEARDEHHTAELIAAQTSIIYQPKFHDESTGVVAQPDFLFLEPEGYRAADAKLAGSLKGKLDLRIQLAVYQRALGTHLPTKALMGNGTEALIGPEDLASADEFLADMQRLANSARPSAHFSPSKCMACPYSESCVPEFQAAGDLGQNYFVDARAIPHLEAQGITSLADLAVADPESVQEVPYLKGEKIRKAVLHAQALLRHEPIVLAQPQPIAGTPIHFDIETNPLAGEGGGEVYLWGFLLPPYTKDDFEYVWHDGGGAADQEGWERFLELVAEHRQRYPDAVYVHYANFERQTIARYARQYDDEAHPMVVWLLEEGGLFDLRKTVVESLVLPTYSYGLKEICKDEDLVNFQWELTESGSQWSVVRYLDFLAASDEAEREAIKAEVLVYNRDDVRATRALEVWLGDVEVMV